MGGSRGERAVGGGAEGQGRELASAGRAREEGNCKGSGALHSTCEVFPHWVPYRCNAGTGFELYTAVNGMRRNK